MDDCIFCRIVKNEVPSDKIYEDNEFVAFLDLRPASKGHTLVVPKVHTEDLMRTPDEILGKLMAISKKIAAGLMKATNASGFNLSINNGTVAGQIIFHIHAHIVPRFEKDGLKLFPQKDSEFGSRTELAAEIKKHLL